MRSAKRPTRSSPVRSIVIAGVTAALAFGAFAAWWKTKGSPTEVAPAITASPGESSAGARVPVDPIDPELITPLLGSPAAESPTETPPAAEPASDTKPAVGKPAEIRPAAVPPKRKPKAPARRTKKAAVSAPVSKEEAPEEEVPSEAPDFSFLPSESGAVKTAD